MPSASILIKPSSANCNIDCKYCFYKCLSSNREEYSKGFMTEETLEQLVAAAIDYAEDYLTFAFQGGEPTLAGLDFFRKAVELQKKHNKKNLMIENTLQTNGMLIDEEWAKFLSEQHFLVGLSLDGPRKLHDRYRKDTLGRDTFQRVMYTVSLFREYQVDYNILSVITNEAAEKASNIYHFYRRNQFPFIQLIPCMDENGRKDAAAGQEKAQNGTGSYAVEPEAYGRFLCEIFDLWYTDFANGYQSDIRMFSNLAQMAAGYPPEECGMNGCCTCYFVVEGDGSVYPCDFYCTDAWKLGNVWDTFRGLIVSEKAKEFVAKSRYVSDKCKECPYFSLCRGGCRRWREPLAEGKLSLNYLCPAYQIFFDHTWDRIMRLGKYITLRQQGIPEERLRKGLLDGCKL